MLTNVRWSRPNLTRLPFTSVMVKLLTWAALSAWSFLTPERLSFVTTASTATSVTAVVKLWLWPPRLILVSPPVVRTELSDTTARRCLLAATSLSCARPLGSSGGEAMVGAIGERAAGSVWRRWADGFLSTQDLVGAHEAAFTGQRFWQGLFYGGTNAIHIFQVGAR